MSSRRWFALAGAAALMIAVGAATGQRPTPPKRKPAATVRRPTPADNSYCLACHLNYKREPLASKHRLAGVGCAKCHGESDKHSSDENNTTAPDVMYPPERVNAACARCHRAETLAALAKRPKTAAHKAVLTPGAKPQVRAVPACTTCHNTHRLTVRTRRWDKTTRKLISDDGVRMLR